MGFEMPNFLIIKAREKLKDLKKVGSLSALPIMPAFKDSLRIFIMTTQIVYLGDFFLKTSTLVDPAAIPFLTCY